MSNIDMFHSGWFWSSDSTIPRPRKPLPPVTRMSGFFLNMISAYLEVFGGETEAERIAGIVPCSRLHTHLGCHISLTRYESARKLYVGDDVVTFPMMGRYVKMMSSMPGGIGAY